MGKYIALNAIQLKDAEGRRVAIEPASDKSSGLFEHEFDKATEKRLLDEGVMRLPEDLEEHADPAETTELVDSRTIDGTATEVTETKGKAAPKKDAKPKSDDETLD